MEGVGGYKGFGVDRLTSGRCFDMFAHKFACMDPCGRPLPCGSANTAADQYHLCLISSLETRVLTSDHSEMSHFVLAVSENCG